MLNGFMTILHVPGQMLARSRFQHEGLAARTCFQFRVASCGADWRQRSGLEPKLANTKKP